jgi:hypothetical protein
MNMRFCDYYFNTKTEADNENDTQKSFGVITNQPQSSIYEKCLQKV